MRVDPSEIIRPASSSDVPGLNALFREVFGHERPASIWRWKFSGNPFGSESWVCESEGEIVAHCGAVGVEMQERGRSLKAYQLVDFMSSPRYTGGLGGGGVFARTTAAMFRKIVANGSARLLYGFPGERHRLVGERLLGYRTVCPVAELHLQPASGEGGWRALRESDLEHFEPLPTTLSTLRSPRYLRWRYLEHPEHQYHVVESRRLFGRRPRSVAIVRKVDDEIRLMEIGGSFAPHHLEGLRRLLERLGHPIVGWGSPWHPLTRALEQTGFEVKMRDHFLTAAWFLKDPEPQARRFFSDTPPAEEDFYFTQGDYDVY
jgi:hypothetical protein